MNQIVYLVAGFLFGMGATLAFIAALGIAYMLYNMSVAATYSRLLKERVQCKSGAGHMPVDIT